MTPRERRLREGIAQAKYQFIELDVAYGKQSDLPYQGAVDAEKAMQEADLIKDGPMQAREKILRDGIITIRKQLKELSDSSGAFNQMYFDSRISELNSILMKADEVIDS